MRILIIEDTVAIKQHIETYFQSLGFVVNSSDNGKEGLYYAREYDFDLAIIDLGLPEIDGLSIIKTLRKEGKVFPILILTARGNWQDKVEGLESGADDYLVKPFHEEELRARANALIRRAAGNASSESHYGPITIDTSSKKVSLNQHAVELTLYEYNTLEYLILHAGKPISKTELTEHLYHQDFERDSNVIEVFIGRLRKKLDPENQLKPIATVRGQGYSFNVEKTRS